MTSSSSSSSFSESKNSFINAIIEAKPKNYSELIDAFQNKSLRELDATEQSSYILRNYILETINKTNGSNPPQSTEYLLTVIKALGNEGTKFQNLILHINRIAFRCGIKLPPSLPPFKSLSRIINNQVDSSSIAPTITSISTLSQNSTPLGEASCGIHALKNSEVVLRLLNGTLNSPTFLSGKNFYASFAEDFNNFKKSLSVTGNLNDDASEIELLKFWENRTQRPGRNSQMNHSIKDQLSFFSISDNEAVPAIPDSVKDLQHLSDLSKKEGPCHHAFVVAINPNNGVDGHWITIIYEKDAEGNVHWYGIDSNNLGAANRIEEAVQALRRTFDHVDQKKLFYYSHLIGDFLEKEYRKIEADINDEKIKIDHLNDELFHLLEISIKTFTAFGWLNDLESHPLLNHYLKTTIELIELYEWENGSKIKVSQTLSKLLSGIAIKPRLSHKEWVIESILLKLKNPLPYKKILSNFENSDDFNPETYLKILEFINGRNFDEIENTILDLSTLLENNENKSILKKLFESFTAEHHEKGWKFLSELIALRFIKRKWKRYRITIPRYPF